MQSDSYLTGGIQVDLPGGLNSIAGIPTSGIVNLQEGYLNPSSGIETSRKVDLNPSSGIVNPQKWYLNPSSGILNLH